MDSDTIGSIAAATSAVVTFVLALRTLSGRSRIRSQLAAETAIWDKLPVDSPSRELMWQLVERSANRLAHLEDPAVRRQRQVTIGVLLAATAILGGNAYWGYRGGGWQGLASSTVTGLLAAAAAYAQNRPSGTTHEIDMRRLRDGGEVAS
jgi:hypothetical protein